MSLRPYIEELTVFVKVKIESLKEFSKLISLRVKRKVKNKRVKIKINIVKKYLWISFNWKNSLENKCLLM